MNSWTMRQGAVGKPLIHQACTEGDYNRSGQMAPYSFRRILRQKVKQSLLTDLDDMMNPYFWVEILVEFLLCCFIGTIVIWALTTLHEATYKPSPTHFGIFAGMMVIALLEGYGPICGAPLNPAGVWGMFLSGRMSVFRGIMYMVAEIAGTAAGGMIGISLTPDPQAQAFKAVHPGEGITVGMGMAIEGILAFNLLFVALTCTDPNTKTCVMPSVPIAFCVAGGIFAAGTHTGGLGNPIITFGPAVATKDFRMHFPVYWAGPFIGTTIAAIFHKLVTLTKKHLDRHRVLQQPEDDDDTSKKNCKSETHSQDNGQVASRL